MTGGMRDFWRNARLVSALALVAAACGFADTEQQAVRVWLLCDECTDGERESVNAIGHRAVPFLTEALRGPAVSYSAGTVGAPSPAPQRCFINATSLHSGKCGQRRQSVQTLCGSFSLA